MKRLLRYLRARHFEAHLEAEIQAHIDEKTNEYVAAGAPAAEARQRALREFGNRTRVVESCREQWGAGLLDETTAHIRYAARALRRSPLFTLIAVSTLALGIGVNTIIFSAIDRVLIHALPYPEPERLLMIWGRAQSSGTERMHVSAADFYDWRAHSRTLAGLAAFAAWPMNLTNVDEPRRLQAELVSANLFAVLKTQPELGRTFRAEEDEPDSRPVVVLSDHLWRALGEPEPGGQCRLNGSDATVIGVMPPNFAFPAPEVDAWVPLSLSAANRANREGRWLQVVGRLNAHSTLDQALGELELIAAHLAVAYPATNKGLSVSVIPLKDQVVGKTGGILWTLQAGALLLLVVTCANLANLLLARSASRAREFGMRFALGAPRGRIVRQLLVESFVLALAGGSLGLAIAEGGIRVLRTFPESLLPGASGISLSAPLLVAALVATASTAILFGIAPALHGSRMELSSEIALGVRETRLHADSKRAFLITVQVAIAAVLLVGAGLLGTSIVKLLAIAPGLRVDDLLAVQLILPHSQYPTNSAQNAIFERVLERVAILPGVSAAAEISDTPLGGNNPTFETVSDRATTSSSTAPLRAGLRAISPGYFSAAGIPILRGRSFSTGDRADSRPVVIVNQTMARHEWAGSNAIGNRIRLKEDGTWMTVVGVVPDIKQMGLKVEEGPVLYIPYEQNKQSWMSWATLLVRTTEPESVLVSIRKTIHNLDRNLPLAEVDSLEHLLSRSTLIPRFVAATVGLISVFSLLVAVIGIYGLLAYAVARRIPELGIRLALGASRLQITWLLLRQTMVRVLFGLVCGLGIAWWAAKLVESQLFEVRPHSPAIFAAAAACLFLSSLIAVLAPAHRAVNIDPSAALRSE